MSSSSVRVFASLAGARTVARLFSAPNQVIYGIYDPTKPTLPLHSPDGNTAYGFRQFFNGYVFGPEGTSLSQLQDAVDAGQLPMIHANSAGVYPRLTIDDYLDAMYINVGTSGSVYSTYVKPVLAVDPPPNVPPVPPVVTPPMVDPCAELKVELENMKEDLEIAQDELDKVDATIDAVKKVVSGVTIPPRGGGVPINALRKIKALLG